MREVIGGDRSEMGKSSQHVLKMAKTNKMTLVTSYGKGDSCHFLYNQAAQSWIEYSVCGT